MDSGAPLRTKVELVESNDPISDIPIPSDRLPQIRPLDRSRLTVVENIYFQNPNEQPTVLENSFGCWIDAIEQPYLRRTKIGESWEQLEAGWLAKEKVGMLVIRNDEGKFPTTYPTDQERKIVESRVIEVFYRGGSPPVLTPSACFIIPPGESIRVQPVNLANLSIRCRSGEARYTLAVFPA